MALNVLQNSFIGGEIAPALYGRIDDKLVAVGAAELTNYLVNISGSLRRRPGFKFMRKLGNGTFRLIPFRFASDQTLVLVFGNKVMYVVAMGQFVMNGNQPYQVTTPYTDTQLYDLSYSQNADVVTLTSPDVAPYELRRYGATDWRFVKISTLPGIDPPSSVSAAASYPPEPPKEEDDVEYEIQSEQKDIITAQYVVTSVDANGVESRASAVATTKCNFYLTGSTVEVSWNAVANAAGYRVYRYVSGVYGFLAQTTQCSISDSGTVPDTSQTPPSHREAFIGAASTGEIISISVIDGGSGYTNVDPTSGNIITFKWLPVVDFYGTAIEPTIIRRRIPFFKLTMISPSGSTYDGYILAGFYKYGTYIYGVQNDDGTYPRAYKYMVWAKEYKKGSGVPVYFDQQITIGEGWRAKIGFYIINVIASNANAIDTTQDLIDYFNKYPTIPKESIGSVPNGPIDDPVDYSQIMDKVCYVNSQEGKIFTNEIPAAGKAHYNASPSNNYYLYSDLWDRANGIDYAELSSDAPSTGSTLPLKISGGTGAQATANVSDGVITGVNLLAGGRGYSNSSTVTVDSKYGSGAKFQVTVSSATPAEFPRCSGQYDQRRVFAGSNKNPLKVWMTNPSQQSLMMTHVPLQADDCIEVVANAEDADMIKHIVGMDSLLLFTGSGEMRVSSTTGGISPATITIRAQSYIGANNVKPVVSGNNVVFISARGGHPYQTVYSDQVASYAPADIGVRCPHLFDGKNIVDMALCKAPINSLWCCSNDGSLYCATYLPDQGINAWTRVDVQGQVESVCAISEGIEDHVYIAVRRNGTVCLERLSEITITNDNDARFVDSFLDAIFTSPQSSIEGLDHLEGQTVAIHGDGEFLGTAVVSGGKVTLPKPCRHVAVGLPIVSRLITIPLEYANTATVMREHNPNAIYLRVCGTGNVKWGVYPLRPHAHMYEAKRDTSIQMVQNPDSKVLALLTKGTWDRQSQIAIESDNTLPLELQTIIADYKVQFNR